LGAEGTEAAFNTAWKLHHQISNLGEHNGSGNHKCYPICNTTQASIIDWVMGRGIA